MNQWAKIWLERWGLLALGGEPLGAGHQLRRSPEEGVL
jgi:hypothetical protein